MTRAVAFALLLFFLAAALAQPSVSVQLMTDATAPVDFGSSYPLGQLNNYGLTYGPNFIIRISVSEVTGSLGLALSGEQEHYQLAWRVLGTTDDQPFGTGLGADVSGLSGESISGYYRSDGTLPASSAEATRYRIGARSTPAASLDLAVLVTLTATLY